VSEQEHSHGPLGISPHHKPKVTVAENQECFVQDHELPGEMELFVPQYVRQPQQALLEVLPFVIFQED